MIGATKLRRRLPNRRLLERQPGELRYGFTPREGRRAEWPGPSYFGRSRPRIGAPARKITASPAGLVAPIWAISVRQGRLAYATQYLVPLTNDQGIGWAPSWEPNPANGTEGIEFRVGCEGLEFLAPVGIPPPSSNPQ